MANNNIIVKFRMLLIILIWGWFFIIPIWGLIDKVIEYLPVGFLKCIHPLKPLPLGVLLICIVSFIILYGIVFCFYPSFTIIIHSTGIERFWKIKIGKFILFQSKMFIYWNEIEKLDHWIPGWYWWGFVIIGHNGGRDFLISFNPLYKNYKLAALTIAKNIDQAIISDKAKKKLALLSDKSIENTIAE